MGFIKEKNKVKIKLFWLLGCSQYFTWEIQTERLNTGQHWCRGIATPNQTITRLIPPSPTNPSENAGYLLLLSPSFHFPAPTAGYCSTVCTLQSRWVKEKTAQVIRKQKNKNRLFLLSLPSSLNKATSQSVNHIVAIIWPYQKPCICYFFCCARRQDKNILLRASHHKVSTETIIYLCMQGISRCRLLFTNYRFFLEERILTREKSCHMFDPNTCWLRSSMVLWDLSILKCTCWNWK